MSDKTGIEWTDATWNPTTGCDRVSPGCDNCYALALAKRLKAMDSPRYQNDGNPRTSGPGFGLTMHPDALDQPQRWTRPRRIFVNSMSDLFHADVDDWFIAQVFAVMALAPQHTFQVLTKRHGRMRSLLSGDLYDLMIRALGDPRLGWNEARITWPLPNVWLGVSVEDQKRADLRIPALLGTPAAVRFLSMEPLLGPVGLRHHLDPERDCNCSVPAMEGVGQHAPRCRCFTQPEISWVIVGGESGHDARPMHGDWARSLRDQTVAAGVAFHFKQWGSHDEHGTPMHKMKAGRTLDGRTWDEFPHTTSLPATGLPPVHQSPGSGAGGEAKPSSRTARPDNHTTPMMPTDRERELARRRQLDAGWSE